MKVLFVEYPKCSTCKKAGKWLQEHGVGYDDRHIVEQNPTAEELKEWHEKSGLPLKRFFNTSGQVYRNNGTKDKLPGMSEKEQYALLATDGMLVKRPIVVGEDFVLVGFKEVGREVVESIFQICSGKLSENPRQVNCRGFYNYILSIYSLILLKVEYPAAFLQPIPRLSR